MAVRNRAELKSDADSSFPDNTTGQITPADVRSRVKDLVDSALLPEDVSPVARSGDYGDLENPPALGSAASHDAASFATAAQGGKADSAMQPAIFNPRDIQADAFHMDNMAEGTDTKVMTAAERTKLEGIGTGADKTTPSNVGSSIAGTSQVAEPADGDRFAGVLAGGTTLFWTTFANIKARLKTYFDTVYVPLSRTITAGTGLTGAGDMTANRTVAIDKASAANLRAGTADKVVTPDIALSAMDWVAITAGATPAVDHAAGVNRTITHSANATMANPTNAKSGWPLNIDITPGAFTTSWAANYKFGAAGAPSITARRIAHFVCRDASTFVFLGLSDPS